jgi:O-antigen ligase
LFLWAVLAIRPDERAQRNLETALYVTCAIACALAAAHLATGDLLGPRLAKTGPFGFAVLASPYTSGANFSFLILTGAATAYCRWLNDRRIVHLLLVILLATALLLSFVRVALAAFVMCIALIHVFRARRLVAIMLSIVALAVVAALASTDVFMKRMFYKPHEVEWSQALSDFDGFMANVNSSGRISIWSDAARDFSHESRWIGAGVGSVDTWIRAQGATGTELHSEVYRLYLETGWLGLGLYSAGLLAFWRAVRRGYREHARRGEPVPVQMQAAAVLLPAYALTLLTDNTLNYASEFGVVVFGLAGVALLQRSAAAQVPVREGHPALRSRAA